MQSELTVDSLAQEIRRVDGNHSLGAGALAEALMPFLSAISDKQAVEVKALEWRRAGWVEAFAKPEGFGFWYSIQPDKPVHGPGDPPFTCSVIWGEPGQNSREYLGVDFQSVEAAKSAAQADYEQRIRSALVDVPAVEPVAWLDDGTCRAGSDRTAHRVVTDAQKRDMPAAVASSFTTPLYSSPPLSREGEDSAEVAAKARTLATAILQHFAAMEDGDGNEAPELAMARDLLAATRSGSATTHSGKD